jgi:glucose/arabinose dehydrogenase
MRTNIFRSLTIVLLAASWICLGSHASQAQTADARVEQLLKSSGYNYTTHSANTWSVEFDRKSIGKVRVIISTGSDIVVTFAILAKKAAINKTPKMMETLLSANHEYDYAKIGLDKDGDLFVRIDSPLRLVDSQELKSIIGQIANASDEIYAKVSGSIKK